MSNNLIMPVSTSMHGRGKRNKNVIALSLLNSYLLLLCGQSTVELVKSICICYSRFLIMNSESEFTYIENLKKYLKLVKT